MMQCNETRSPDSPPLVEAPGATLRSVIAASATRLIRPFRESIWQQELHDREAYLAGAQNIADVEARMRALERAAFSRYGSLG